MMFSCLRERKKVYLGKDDVIRAVAKGMGEKEWNQDLVSR
jgi:hypothetical protein